MKKQDLKNTALIALFLALGATSQALAASGTVFPPDRLDLCTTQRGVLSWKQNENVECRKLPAATCPNGQVVIYRNDGFYCDSPIGACTGTQVLVAKNVGSNTVFSCEEILPRINVSCPEGSAIKSITNGSPTCIAINCGSHINGTTWTETCPPGQEGSIQKTCSMGTVTTTTNTCTTPAAPSGPVCGSCCPGDSQTTPCASGVGWLTYSCINGSMQYVAGVCGPPPSGSGPCPPGQTQQGPFGQCY